MIHSVFLVPYDTCTLDSWEGRSVYDSGLASSMQRLTGGCACRLGTCQPCRGAQQHLQAFSSKPDQCQDRTDQLELPERLHTQHAQHLMRLT